MMINITQTNIPANLTGIMTYQIPSVTRWAWRDLVSVKAEGPWWTLLNVFLILPDAVLLPFWLILPVLVYKVILDRTLKEHHRTTFAVLCSIILAMDVSILPPMKGIIPLLSLFNCVWVTSFPIIAIAEASIAPGRVASICRIPCERYARFASFEAIRLSPRRYLTKVSLPGMILVLAVGNNAGFDTIAPWMAAILCVANVTNATYMADFWVKGMKIGRKESLEKQVSDKEWADENKIQAVPDEKEAPPV